MKYLRIIFISFLIVLLGHANLDAQSLKGMSLSGATGLYSIPSGRIGWERSSDFGLDLGYHTIISGGKAAHIPKLSASLFKWLELSGAFDIRPENERGNDFLTGIKIQFPITRTALALGGNIQSIGMGENEYYTAGQVYLAVSYAGTFFDMPAETTVVLGKTFRDPTDSSIDFGMGFDMLLLPGIFEGFVHWITDFSNFSYSDKPYGADSIWRGVLNTGLRIDLSRIPALNRFKFVIDVMMVDAFDKNRAFSMGLVFGIPIL